VRRFAELYRRLDASNRTTEKVRAFEAYFRGAPAEDAAWALAVFAGRRVKRSVSYPAMMEAAGEATGLPGWLIGACREQVGDSSETLSLLLPEPARAREYALHEVFEELVLPMRGADRVEQKQFLRRAWGTLPSDQVLAFHKLLTGTFRVGASAKLLTRALAMIAGVEPGVMAQRLMGRVLPTAGAYGAIISPSTGEEDATRPYPFCLAHQLDGLPESLGEAKDWLAEWKWDGVRAQLLRRHGRVALWSRGEESLERSFPEIVAIGRDMPDGCVLDGEILAWDFRVDAPLPFQDVQARLGRKRVDPGLFDTEGFVFMVFDALDVGGEDIRARSLSERRERLADIIEQLRSRGAAVRLSEVFWARSWEQFAERRREARSSRHAEGLMLKHKQSAYHVGRVRGGETPGWWKWKLDPHTVDAVLIAAQPGSGRRAGLFTDYTFGVWNGGELAPFAKAYSGLTEQEIRSVDKFVRQNTLRRAGPVRFVKPSLVFEIAFQQIAASARHKAGVAVRFPRIARWRHDKQPHQADSIEVLRALLPKRR
jgi:DNA ligase-1